MVDKKLIDGMETEELRQHGLLVLAELQKWCKDPRYLPGTYPWSCAETMRARVEFISNHYELWFAVDGLEEMLNRKIMFKLKQNL